MKYRLKLPENIYERILSLVKLKDEQAGFILAGPMKRAGSVTLLARKLLVCSSEELKDNSRVHVEVSKDFARRVLTICRRERLCLVYFHTHPFSSRKVSFSSIDDACDGEFFPYVARKIPEIYHATLVLGQKDLDARIYDKKLGSALPVTEITVLGGKLKKLIPNSASQEGTQKRFSSGFFNRQIRFLGEAGQRILSTLSCAIIGSGGTGSLIFEALLRLGVGKLLIIDPDRIEVSNLNRIIQAFEEDVRSKRLKVEIMKRKARMIDRRTKVISLARSILEKSAQSALKGVDVIFGAVDNDLARLVLTKQAAKYLIPLIDVATGINVNKQGNILDFAGQVYVFIPGKSPCLACLDAIDMREVSLSLMSDEDKELRRQYGYVSGEDITAPAVLPLNMELVSLALIEFMNLIFGFRKVNNYVFYNGLSEEKIAYAIEAKPESACTICSPGGLLAKGDLAESQELLRAKPPSNIPKTRGVSSRKLMSAKDKRRKTNG